MRVLFVHQNAPGQFRYLAPHLGENPANEVVMLGERNHVVPGRVRWVRYPAAPTPPETTHQYLRRVDTAMRRGQAVARACLRLRDEGFTPDVVVGHAGWGETLFVPDILPRARVLAYCEMFYRPDGQDTGFVPETAIDLDGKCRLRAWNAPLLAALDGMDRGLSPTAWQRAQHPAAYQPRISVIHEGVDTNEATPDPQARFALPGGRVLTADDEVVTFVARNLEPVRGFTTLMRALPDLLRRRPRAQVVICGDDGVSYGRSPPGGGTWREALSREVVFDPGRVHFVGRLERAAYLSLLQVSSLHLYLTVPFVLSWSFIEALSAGCLVLASDVAPVAEVVEHTINGFLTDARDPAVVAADAATLLAGRETLRAVRRRARQVALDRFDLRACVAAQAELVRTLAA